MKRYYTQSNVGKCKYIVNYHNGISKHKDNSDFYDIKIFSNKQKLHDFINNLTIEGFVEEN